MDWKLFQSEPDGKGRCYALETEPELENIRFARPELFYQGKLPLCGVDAGNGNSKYIGIFSSNQATSQHSPNYLVANVAPEVDSVRVTIRSQTSDGEHSKTVDTKEGFLLLFYPNDKDLISMEPFHDMKVIVKCDTREKGIFLEGPC